MSKLTRFQKIAILSILVLILLGIGASMLPNATVYNSGSDVVSMFRHTFIDNPVRVVKGWIQDFSNLWSIQDENKQLKLLLEKQPQYEALLQEEQKKVKEYEELLGLRSTLQQYDQVFASVIARDQDMWNHTLVINKGSKDHIQKDMAVMSSKGMIGKVIEVSEFTSKVKLLISEDRANSVSVKVTIDDETSSEGILQRYDAEKGVFIVHIFANTDKIEKDMKVVTSGNGGVYPSGLLIGSVSSVEAFDNQVGTSLYVEPAADFHDFQTVVVVNQNGEE